jgi:predicted DNA-binding protein (UPF0251 family)
VVDRLDQACAEVLVYRYFDDLTQDEIAALQEVSRKTVGTRLGRVRQAVQALLREEGHPAHAAAPAAVEDAPRADPPPGERRPPKERP